MKCLVNYVILLLLLVGCAKTSNKRELATIIPNPLSNQTASGSFKLKDGLTMKSNSALILLQERNLTQFYEKYCSLDIKKAKTLEEAHIKIIIDKRLKFGEEGYSIKVTKKEIVVKASSKGGVVYAIESLKQLTNKDKDGQCSISCVTVTDKPVYKDRILRVDVSQQPLSVDELKGIINSMAYVKLNRLILVVGRGDYMRVHIPSYPKLTDGTADLYSLNDISNLLNYGERYNVKVIPEVVLFDDNQAIKKNYPHLCDGSSYGEVVKETNFEQDCFFNLSNKEVPEFLNSVIRDISKAFRSKYICIGDIKELLVDQEHFKDLIAGSELDQLIDNYTSNQSKLLKLLDKQFYEKGKELIFVNEAWKYTDRKRALTLVTTSTAVSYVNMNKGLRVVEAPAAVYDLDRPQRMIKNTSKVKNFTTLRKIYEFTPEMKGKSVEGKHVVGVCAMIDASKSATAEELIQKLFPRILAISERGWAGERMNDWDNFHQRVHKIEDVFKNNDISYGDPSYGVIFQNSINEEGQVVMTLSSEGEAPKYYTTDGSKPTKASIKYDGPVVMPDKYKVRASSLRPDGTWSTVRTRRFMKHLGFNKEVSVKYPFSKLKNSSGGKGICDGVVQLFQRMDLNNINLTVDLGQKYPINHIGSNWSIQYENNVFMPSSVSYFMSNDGKRFQMVYKDVYDNSPNNTKRRTENVSCFPGGKEARYIRIVAMNIRVIPNWHTNKGQFATLYMDELVIE
ncbi:family 20 glycosylhydrolase [Prolixibacteraceae bacterium]|nr:family 20 glycosylhydrolase [Prolixibacteraceae bacterium]